MARNGKSSVWAIRRVSSRLGRRDLYPGSDGEPLKVSGLRRDLRTVRREVITMIRARAGKGPDSVGEEQGRKVAAGMGLGHRLRREISWERARENPHQECQNQGFLGGSAG